MLPTLFQFCFLFLVSLLWAYFIVTPFPSFMPFSTSCFHKTYLRKNVGQTDGILFIFIILVFPVFCPAAGPPLPAPRHYALPTDTQVIKQHWQLIAAPSSSRIGNLQPWWAVLSWLWLYFGRVGQADGGGRWWCNRDVHHNQSETADEAASTSVATGDAIRQMHTLRSLKRLLWDILLLWQHQDEAIFSLK